MTRIDELIVELTKQGAALTAAELADALFLAPRLPVQSASSVVPKKPSVPPSGPDMTRPPLPPIVPLPSSGLSASEDALIAQLHLPSASESASSDGAGGLLFAAPRACALPAALQIVRALRPLRLRVPSRRRFELDESATAHRIATERLWLPVLRPLREQWAELALVIDDSSSMALWHEELIALMTLLEHLGAFQRVVTWRIDTETSESLSLRKGFGSCASSEIRGTQELLEPSGRRMIWVISDTVGTAWRDGRMASLLSGWGHSTSVSLLHMLPQRLWIGTAAGDGVRVMVRTPHRGAPNSALRIAPSPIRRRNAELKKLAQAKSGLPIPIATFAPTDLADLACLLANQQDACAPALFLPTQPLRRHSAAAQQCRDDASSRLTRFDAMASPLAQRLARLLSAAPLGLPVMRMVQQTMLPGATQAHLAEFFLGGLIQDISDAATPLSGIRYDFHPGVRDLLMEGLPIGESVEVLKRTSGYIQAQIGQPWSFAAVLAAPESTHPDSLTVSGHPFARVTARVLMSLGGRHAALARRLQDEAVERVTNPPGWVKDIAAACVRIETPAATGAGFLVRSDLVLTCRHVLGAITEASSIRVFFDDSARRRVRTVHRIITDDEHDLAALQLNELVIDIMPPILADAPASIGTECWAVTPQTLYEGIAQFLPGIIQKPQTSLDYGACDLHVHIALPRLSAFSGACIVSNGQIIGQSQRSIWNPIENRIGPLVSCSSARWLQNLTESIRPEKLSRPQLRKIIVTLFDGLESHGFKNQFLGNYFPSLYRRVEGEQSLNNLISQLFVYHYESDYDQIIRSLVTELGVEEVETAINMVLESRSDGMRKAALPRPILEREEALKMMRNAHALVIGISQYQHLRRLPIAMNDALDVAATLRASDLCGYPENQVSLLLDDEATRDRIEAELQALARRTDSDSTVFIYFAGHGGRIRSGPQAGGYLIPVDAPSRRLSGEDGYAKSAISEVSLSRLLASIPARSLMVVLDCCYAGSLASLRSEAVIEGTEGFTSEFVEALQHGVGNRAILAGANSHETAKEMSNARNGVFTQYLLQGLRGAGGGGSVFIDAFELYRYVHDGVTRLKLPTAQTPILKMNAENPNFFIAVRSVKFWKGD